MGSPTSLRGMMPAFCIQNVVASFGIPPVAERTRGVKDECSTSLTLCSYARFFRDSCLR